MRSAGGYCNRLFFRYNIRYVKYPVFRFYDGSVCLCVLSLSRRDPGGPINASLSIIELFLAHVLYAERLDLYPLAEHLAVSARNGLMGSSVLHIAWLNKWIVFPLFLFYFYGPGGSIRNRWESGACWSVFLRLCLCHLPHYPLGLLDPHWQFHEPALHCFLGNLFLPFPQPFAPCYDKILDWAGIGRYPVLLVGAGKTAQLLLRGIKDDVGLNYHVIGYVDDAGERKENVGNLPYLGTLDEIEPILTKRRSMMFSLPLPGFLQRSLTA